MWLFHHYSDVLSLLQCQSATNVTIVVQLHINKEKITKKNWKFVGGNPRQIIVKTASDAEKQRL